MEKQENKEEKETINNFDRLNEKIDEKENYENEKIDEKENYEK
jgi:hypothetical protein